MTRFEQNIALSGPIGATTVGTGGDFLAVVFKKQEFSQQVLTRMQDLASEFS